MGSVVGIFDKDGNYYGGYSYTPYGDARYTSSNAALSNNHIRYAGGYYDTSSNLYLFGARYYNPATGRFTQTDPSGQEQNNYSYAEDNPINATDSDGTLSIKAIAKIVKEFGKYFEAVWDKVEKGEFIVTAAEDIWKHETKKFQTLVYETGISFICTVIFSVEDPWATLLVGYLCDQLADAIQETFFK